MKIMVDSKKEITITIIVFAVILFGFLIFNFIRATYVSDYAVTNMAIIKCYEGGKEISNIKQGSTVSCSVIAGWENSDIVGFEGTIVIDGPITISNVKLGTEITIANGYEVVDLESNTAIIVNTNGIIANELVTFDITADSIKENASATIKLSNSNYVLKDTAETKVISSDTESNYISTNLSIIGSKDNNYLTSLSIDKGTLSPTFSPDVTKYEVSVANSIKSITISANKSDENATIESGLGEHKLNVGTNEIKVIVVSEIGSKKYIL